MLPGTAALGGHVARCQNDACGHTVIAYNSCRNRHCPKCQGAAARAWLEERKAELLPVPYFHVVYTLPAPIADLAYTNKAVVYDILFKASAEATITIAADKKRLGARVGITSVLHTWGSAMTHHPHVHMIVPGGGLSEDGTRWVAGRTSFCLSACCRGCSAVSSSRCWWRLTPPASSTSSASMLGSAIRTCSRHSWHRSSDQSGSSTRSNLFGGPEAVLAYLSRYTHRVAISNRRLVAADATAVTFKYKDYRVDGRARFKTMTLATAEFIRRFLSHVLPKGFHRIRHYGLLANGQRADTIAKARELLAVAAPSPEPEPEGTDDGQRVHPRPCPCCGGRMLVIEIFARGSQPRYRPSPTPNRIDTS